MSLVNPLYPLLNSDLSGVSDPNQLRFMKNTKANIEAIDSKAVSINAVNSAITDLKEANNEFTGKNTFSSTDGNAPLILEQTGVTDTNFKAYKDLDGTIIWKSDGTTPNGNLTGNTGDLCLNGPSGQAFYCVSGTTWTGM